MKNKPINAKVYGLVTALLTFLLVRFILGKNEDGNLVVFGVPAIIGGLVVFSIVRSLGQLPRK